MRKLLALSVLIVGFALASTPAHAGTVSGKVASVGDGDTLAVTIGGKRKTVRLACIDAPEMKQGAWGKQSSAKLKGLLPIGQSVKLREIETDKYGRTVGEIFVGNKSINLEMVKAGQAAVYRQYLDGCGSNKQAFLDAENNAISKKLGFWNQACPTMPWDFRRGKSAKCSVTTQSSQQQSGYIPGTCKQLKAMGVGPFHVGDPNYTSKRDGDGDGIACE